MHEKYEKYAQLLLTRCLNITTEKKMIINAPIEAIDFVRVVARQAYELGIQDIHFDFEDEELKHDQLKYLDTEDLYKSSFWNKKIYDEYARDNGAILKLIAGDDDLMKDIDPEKLDKTGKFYRTSSPVYKERQLKYQIPWCIAGVATERWANKVFPNDENSKQKLWDLIFRCCLLEHKDPICAWNQKIANYNTRRELLNRYQFEELHYQNEQGTDLKIKLPKGHVWNCAGKKFASKKDGIANMPSEEVFTSPQRNGINGIVYSSKPLIYNGGLIDEFYLRFKNGKIDEVGAKTGLELLKKIITSCENADMLGEVALVDYDSPISRSNVVFYTTLFDENASCHLALGAGFPNCLENGTSMTKEELLANGINQSNIHVDFMIGTEDLTITGTTPNKQKVKVFEKGNFVLR